MLALMLDRRARISRSFNLYPFIPIAYASATRDTTNLPPEQRFIDTFIDYNPHLCSGGEKFFGLFESGNGHCAGDGGKSCKEFFERIAAFEVVEHGLDGDAGPAEDGSTAKDAGSLVMMSLEGIVLAYWERV